MIDNKGTVTKFSEASSDGRYLFLQKTYDETLQMLEGVTAYFQANGKRDRFNLSAEDRIKYTVAMSVVTIQLTSVMSWLMAWKAVEAEEITPEQALSDKYCLQTVLIEYEHINLTQLKAPIPQFLDKSIALYRRIQRLEQSMRDHHLSKSDI